MDIKNNLTKTSLGKLYISMKRSWRMKPVMTSPPKSVAVILEGRGCNSKCVYCHHRLRNNGTTNGISPIIVRSLDRKGINAYRFGGGEPLIYPEFFRVSEIAAYRKAVLNCCTNGIALDKIAMATLSMPNVRTLAVSMDSCSRGVYHSVRGIDAFDTVCSNITHWRNHNPDKQLQLNFVITSINMHEIASFVPFARDLGATAVNYNLLITREGTPSDLTPNVESAINHLSYAQQFASDYGLQFIHPGKAEARVTVPKIDWSRAVCDHPFNNLSVGDNRINFCCWCYPEFSTARYTDPGAELMDLWNHPKLVEARELMLSGQIQKVCHPRCPLLVKYHVKEPK